MKSCPETYQFIVDGKPVYGPWNFYVLVYDYCVESGSIVIHKYRDWSCTVLIESTSYFDEEIEKHYYNKKVAVAVSPYCQNNHGKWACAVSREMDYFAALGITLNEKMDFRYMFGFTGMIIKNSEEANR